MNIDEYLTAVGSPLGDEIILGTHGGDRTVMQRWTGGGIVLWSEYQPQEGGGWHVDPETGVALRPDEVNALLLALAAGRR